MLLQPVDAGMPHVGEGIEGWPAPCNSSMSATMAGSGTREDGTACKMARFSAIDRPVRPCA
jgi:hypothetical protein